MLGYYLLAYNISSWVPGMVGTAVRYVSIPAFSRLAEGETDDVALGVPRRVPLMVSVVAPVAAVMATLSPALIHVLYGADWVPAAEALRFLAFVMVARMFTALVFDIQTGLGNTRVTIWLNLAWLSRLAPCPVGRREHRRHPRRRHGPRRRRAPRGHPVGNVAAAPCGGRHEAGSPTDRPSCPRGGHGGAGDGRGHPASRLPVRSAGDRRRSGWRVYLVLAFPAQGRVAARAWAGSLLAARREARA